MNISFSLNPSPVLSTLSSSPTPTPQTVETLLNVTYKPSNSSQILTTPNSIKLYHSNIHHFFKYTKVFRNTHKTLHEYIINSIFRTTVVKGYNSSLVNFNYSQVNTSEMFYEKFIKRVFEGISERSGNQVKYRLFLSVFEIKNNRINDLLSEENEEEELKIYNKKNYGKYIDGLIIINIKRQKKVMGVIKKILRQRAKRGHLFFQFHVSKYHYIKNNKYFKAEKLNKINIIELNTEMKYFNTEFSFLKRIVCLNKKINLRDSKLTYLLNDFLIGDWKTYLLMNCEYLDTEEDDIDNSCRSKLLRNLKFLKECKKMKTKSKKQKSKKITVLLDDLRKELKLLHKKLKNTIDNSKSELKSELIKQSNLEKEEFDKEFSIKMKNLKSIYKENYVKKQNTILSLRKTIEDLKRLNVEKDKRNNDLVEKLNSLKVNHLNELKKRKNENVRKVNELNKKILAYEELLKEKKNVIEDLKLCNKNKIEEIKSEVKKYKNLFYESEKREETMKKWKLQKLRESNQLENDRMGIVNMIEEKIKQKNDIFKDLKNCIVSSELMDYVKKKEEAPTLFSNLDDNVDKDIY